MKKNKWKNIAIIFIILFAIETLLVIILFSWGWDIMDKESECSINICGEYDSNSFYYDSYEDVCYCYKDNEIVYQRYMGKDSDLITGQAIFGEDRDDLRDEFEEQLIPNEVESKDGIEATEYFEAQYVIWDYIVDNEDGEYVKIKYTLDSEDNIDFLLLPSYADATAYAKRSNDYDWYNGCTGYGKHIEGECVVNDASYVIWNVNPYAITVDYKFEIIE